MPHALAIVALAASGLFASATATAQTIRTVCASGCDFTSINAAIDASSNGDVIQLSAEIYSEGSVIDLDGKQITIIGTVDGDGLPTSILDGADAHRVIVCVNGETDATQFENLVIQNGYASGNSPDNLGGGMYINGLSSPTLTSPTLTNCMFMSNYAADYGGGMYNSGGSPTLTNCSFENNSAFYDGGGMYNLSGNNSNLTNCTFENNSAFFDGGGMYNDSSSPTLTNCTFTGNEADENGGGMYNTDNSNPDLTNCTLCGNSPNQIGGGNVNEIGNCIVALCLDTDGDGTLDCNDNCPNDPNKTEPGACGCGVADSACGCNPPDADGDGTPDCIDTEINVAPGAGAIGFAISIAEDGDVIQLESGDYHEGSTIDTLGKAITLRGVADADGDGVPETILDGDGAHRVLRHEGNNGGGSLVLEDLFIRHGADAPKDAPAGGGGAGVYVRNGSATLRRCRLEENVSADWGGGLFVEFATVDLESCTLKANQARYGGGLCLENGSAVLTNCTLEENQAVKGRGGGVYAGDYGNSPDASLTLTDCTLSSNTAVESGGGILVELMSATLTGCTFDANTTPEGGGGLVLDSANATVTDCVFTGNSAQFGAGCVVVGAGTLRIDTCQFIENDAQYGGGIAIEYGSSPTVVDCTFTRNSAADQGGGVLCTIGSSPTIDTCTLIENHSNGNGGGMAIWNEGETSQPTVRDCTFDGNTAANFGGGVYQLSGGSPELNGCLFASNQALAGGGVYLDSQSTANLIECEFTDNSATGENGGGLAMTGEGTDPTLDNCTFTSNTATNHGGGIYNGNGSPSLSDCTFTGNTAGTHGGGMANEYFGAPTLAGCVFTGNDAGVAGGGLSSLFGSPTVTATDSSFCENTVGAVATLENQIEGSDLDPASANNCILASCGSCDLDRDGLTNDEEAAAGTEPLDPDSDDDGVLDGVDGCPTDPLRTEPGPCGCGVTETDTDGDGIPDCTDQYPNDWDNDGDPDGTDEVLNVAPGTPGLINQAIERASPGFVVQLEAGVYSEGSTIDTLGKAITLRGVADADGDGVPETILNGANAHRVIQCVNSETAATLFEYLVIQNGYADYGGGMYNYDNSNPTLDNCTFTGNAAGDGGGMSNKNSSPTLDNCTFTGNDAYFHGGGMYNDFYSSPTLTNCTFDSNSAFGDSATTGGGGMYNYFYSSPTLDNCTFTGNESDYDGGGMNNYESNPTLDNCTFTDNSATTGGGGMYNYSSSPTLTNCTFTNNSAYGSGGGGMRNGGSSPTLTNCTLCRNSPNQISGVYTDGGGNCITQVCDVDTDGDGIPDCTDQYPNDWDNDGDPDGTDEVLNVAPGTPGLINQAIGRAAENNVIQFAAGTYAEGAPIDTLGKTLTFRGVVDVDGEPASILDGGGVHQVLAGTDGGTDGGAPATVQFENLVIRNGLAEAGGGMRLAGDGHTYEIVNCSIESNQAQNAGGGVFLAAGASAELANTTVWGNSAVTGGGGMHVAGSPRLELVDSRFGYNTAGTAGGGLEVDDPTGVSSEFSILTTSFTHNEAPIGAGLRLSSQGGTAPSISFTTIAANQVGEGLVVEGAWTGNLPMTACDINANALEGVANLQSAGIVLVDRTTICGNGVSGQVAGSVFETAGGASCISDTCDADGDNQADCGPGDGFTGFFGDDPDGLLDPFFVNGLDAWLSFNRVFALAGVDPLGTALPAGFETTVLLSGSSWGSVNDNGVAQDICWSPGAPITFGADAVIRPGDRFQGMSAESPRVESTTEAYAALEVYRTTETGEDVLWYSVKTDPITGSNQTPGVIRTLSGTLTIPPEDADQVSRVAYVIELQQQADFDTGRILFTNAFVETECGSCVGDVNGDGMVDAADLGLLIGAWGTADPAADITGDGNVDAADLGLLIGAWGLCP